MLKLLGSKLRELQPILVFIWAKILSVDPVSGRERGREGGRVEEKEGGWEGGRVEEKEGGREGGKFSESRFG